MSKEYTVMITPAKWQTAEADQKIASNMSYGEFRQKLVPHMRYVCFYPSANEVFDIEQRDGVVYFLLDKDEHTKCMVKNRCKSNKHMENESVRDIRGGQTLHNNGQAIIEFLGEYQKYRFDKIPSKQYQVWYNTQLSGAGGNMFTKDGTTMCTCKGEIVDTKKHGSPTSMTSQLMFSSDSLDECQSYMSWMDSKLVRFLILVNISKLTGIFTPHYLRFVPATPDRLNHIYTDEELYKAFNLPQKYIDVIEAIIKERK